MTTRAAPEFATVAELPEAPRTAMRQLVLACADTKLLLGYHYGEWTFGTPALEAAIANCSLAQTELGHVRLLHAILRNHYDDDADALIERRAPDEFASVAYLHGALTDWPSVVAANCVVDLAVTRVLHTLQGSAFKPLRMSVEKILDEERYHALHGRGWLRTLGGRRETRAAVERAVNAALASVLEWLGPDDDPGDRALVETGCKAVGVPELRAALLGDLAEVAGQCAVRLDASLPAFEGWNPATRRVRRGGPDAEMLEHLRGSKNEVFKL